MQLSLARWCTAALLVGAGIGPIVHVAFADGPDGSTTTPAVTDTQTGGDQDNQRPGWGCGDENHEHLGVDDKDSPCQDKDKDAEQATTDQTPTQDASVQQPAGDSKEKEDKGVQGNSTDVRQDGDHRPEAGEQGNSADHRQDGDHRPAPSVSPSPSGSPDSSRSGGPGNNRGRDGR